MWGDPHILNVGILLALGEIARLTYQKLRNIKSGNLKGGTKGEMDIGKERNRDSGKNKGKCINSGANVRSAVIGNGIQRNAVIYANQTDAAYEENDVDFPDREVLIAMSISDRSEWRMQLRGQRPSNDCSCIIDAGFNGGALCSFNWMRRYKDYPRNIYPQISKYISV